MDSRFLWLSHFGLVHGIFEGLKPKPNKVSLELWQTLEL